MAKLSVLIKGYKGRLSRVHRDSCLDLGNRIVESTPVDTGDARRRWTPNGIPRLGRIYSFTNNIEHILPLENGWSDQAPGGMVKINTRNWSSIVSDNL